MNFDNTLDDDQDWQPTKEQDEETLESLGIQLNVANNSTVNIYIYNSNTKGPFTDGN